MFSPVCILSLLSFFKSLEHPCSCPSQFPCSYPFPVILFLLPTSPWFSPLLLLSAPFFNSCPSYIFPAHCSWTCPLLLSLLPLPYPYSCPRYMQIQDKTNTVYLDIFGFLWNNLAHPCCSPWHTVAVLCVPDMPLPAPALLLPLPVLGLGAATGTGQGGEPVGYREDLEKVIRYSN